MPRIAANQCASNHSAHRDADWCPGCGLYAFVHSYHRADCTTRPPPCPSCLYHLWVHGVHHADCKDDSCDLPQRQ